MLTIKPLSREDAEKTTGAKPVENALCWAADDAGQPAGYITVVLGTRPAVSALQSEDWLWDGLVKTAADFLRGCGYTELLGTPATAEKLLTLRYFRAYGDSCVSGLDEITGECAK